MENQERRRRIVILGAGFGGLTAAVELSRRLGSHSGIEIVVIEQQTHHLYRPWLYEVATGEASEERLKTGVATPYEDLRTHLVDKGVRVEYQEVLGIDWTTKAVKLVDESQMPFDYLVVAVGAVPDFYGIEGLEQHANSMYSLRDALTVNRKLHALVEKKRRNVIPFIRIMIGGAGPTGVEFACEAAVFMRSQVRKGILAAGEYSIEIVDASARPLQSFHKTMSAWAQERLEKLGIKLILDACIKGAHRDHVVLAPRPLKEGETPDMLVCDFKNENQKEMTTDMLVWCGGFRARPLARELGLQLNERGKIEVDERMMAKGHDSVWAVGDCVSLIDPVSKRPVPQLAQAAIHEAGIAAENIVRAIRGQSPVKYTFPYMHSVVPMGGSWGIADVFGFRLRGLIVWPIRLSADIGYFLKVLPWKSAWKLIRAPLTFFRRNNL